jgi:predicted ester cyclase
VGNTGLVDRLPKFMSSDCRIPNTNIQGLEWFREHLLMFHRCYPDMVFTVDGQIAEEDIVVTWWTMRGTHSGDWGDLRATHKPIHLSGVNIQKVRRPKDDGDFACDWRLGQLKSISINRKFNRSTILARYAKF